MRNSITFFGIFGLVFTSVSCVSYDEDVSLSASQASAFQQFKAHVIPKLKRDFEKEDLYLLQFLRAKKFDVDEAERFILRESKWRTEQGFDGIHNEDWSDMECCYPVFLEGVDREGKPLLIFDIGEWDIRAAVVAGKADRMAKWMSKNYDLARMRTRELGKEGKNVTRFSLIYDMKGFSATSISAASLPFYATAATALDQHFPNMFDKLFQLNSPPIFETVVQVMRPLMSYGTQSKSMEIGGRSGHPKLGSGSTPHKSPSDTVATKRTSIIKNYFTYLV